MPQSSKPIAEIIPEILKIQDLDMKMIRLMRVKNERLKELQNLQKIKMDLRQQLMIKEGEVIELKKNIRIAEGEIAEIVERIKALESRQHEIKKVEEYNALTHEISGADKERHQKENRLSDYYDKLAIEEDLMRGLRDTLDQTTINSKALEDEITEGIKEINAEGRTLKAERDRLVLNCDPEVFKIYERLLRNKKDRVVVPIENRCCSGCHIMLTAQHENLVRKGSALSFVNTARVSTTGKKAMFLKAKK